MKQIKDIFDKYDRTQAVKNKFNIEFIYEVKYGNPNGDPDSENLPRIEDVSGTGYVTDVCIKNKIRKYVMDAKREAPGFGLYIKNDKVLNEKHREAYYSINETPKENKLPKDELKAEQIKQFMCLNFWDIRSFGAMMNTEINAGQIRGPIQLPYGQSVDPVEPMTITITRQAITKVADRDKPNTMGTKTLIPYGLYRQRIYVNPGDAEKTGFTYGDLELLVESLLYMFEIDRAAARGEINLVKLVVFEHSSQFGDCSSKKLTDSIKVEKLTDIPRDYSDYCVTLNKNILPESIGVYDIEVI